MNEAGTSRKAVAPKPTQAAASPPPPPLRVRELIAAGGLYLLLALAATWPLALHIGTHTPGAPSWGNRYLFFETPVNLWNLWWFRHAVVSLGQSPFECSYLFYPWGASLWFHSLAPLYGLVGLVLQPVVSLYATENAIVLLDLVAAGCLTYALGRYLRLRRPAALLAGALYAFSPPVFSHLYVGHFELMATFWLPAALLLFLRVIDESTPRHRDAVGLGLVIIGAAYSCQYYEVYSAELLLLVAAFRHRQLLRPVVLRRLALTALVVSIGMAPILWVYLGSRDSAPGAPMVDTFGVYSGDALGVLVPSFAHPLLARPLTAVHALLMQPLPQETTMYLGVSVLALAALGLWRGRRNGKGDSETPNGLVAARRLLLPIVVVFWVLSLGSTLKVAGQDTGVPLPAGLLVHVPVLNEARAPGRHIVVAALGVALLAGLGWERVRSAGARWGLVALMAFEYAAVPFPIYRAEVPEVYQRLAATPGDFAVLELPFGVRDGTREAGVQDNLQMLGQTVHGHPLLSGMVSRLPAATWAEIMEAPLVGTFLSARKLTPEALQRDRELSPGFFAKWHIDAVVVHPSERGGPRHRYIEALLPVVRRETFADGTELLWLAPH